MLVVQEMQVLVVHEMQMLVVQEVQMMQLVHEMQEQGQQVKEEM